MYQNITDLERFQYYVDSQTVSNCSDLKKYKFPIAPNAVNRTCGRRLYGSRDTGSYTVACSDFCRDLTVRVWYGTTRHNPLVDGRLRASYG
jgi:hypothetical protein